ncbi:MAG: D-alanine--D-alanine ligase [Deltaproteobacteria bacterium HGW-Deltaproteobacteria-12]|jgi:D-alanine-D-alanine ligase|nr:MAG: D-alanine--D-alanine ligase [Deltaproteobacteria bacterium HGW-Deltaproteobacteria-12]
MTYDLRNDYLKEGFTHEETAEFDLPDTIEAIEKVISDSGYQTDRIGNIRALTRRLAAGEHWDLVFNIAEGLAGFGREAQVPALLEAYNIPYTFSDPLGMALTLHKGVTKHIINDLGIPTPAFTVIKSEEEIAGVTLPFPLFAKPVAEGTGKGITAKSKINTREELRLICREILKTFRQPVLLETYLPGREFTVGILGTGKDARALGVMEVILRPTAEKNAYSYENKENYVKLVHYALVDDEEARRARDISLAAWRGLDLKDAGRVDLRSDAHGLPNFMEVNALAGLNPVRSDLPILCNLLGITYQELISSIIESALRRANIK